MGVSIFMIWVLMLVAVCDAQEWQAGQASFYYGAPGGACGYGLGEAERFYKQEFTAAINGPLFQNGTTCGSCWLVKCVNSRWCKNGTIQVVATDFCPTAKNGVGNPEANFFDLSESAFTSIAHYEAGYIPIQIARTPCDVNRGMYFTLTGNPRFFKVLVWKVGGVAEVVEMSVTTAFDPSPSDWIVMSKNWGQNWQLNGNHWLQGKALSFKVKLSDGSFSVSFHAAPIDWAFGQTYKGTN